MLGSRSALKNHNSQSVRGFRSQVVSGRQQKGWGVQLLVVCPQSVDQRDSGNREPVDMARSHQA